MEWNQTRRTLGVVVAMSVVFIFTMAIPQTVFAANSPLEGEDNPVISWSLEYDETVSSSRITASGSLDAAVADMQSALQAGLADTGIQSSIVLVDADRAAVLVSVQGATDSEMLRRVIYEVLPPDYYMLAGPVELTFSAPFSSGQPFSVDLESNLSTGNSWQLDETSVDVFTETLPTQFDNRDVLPGDNSKQSLFLQPVGEADSLKLAYRRPWEPDIAPTRRLRFEMAELPSTFDLTNPTPPRQVARFVEDVQTPATSDVPLRGLPSQFDWRDTGKVTSVKNQANCGSCWAFSAVGAMEAAILVKGGPTTDLSEQYLVSCTLGDNYGCGGGFSDAHKYHTNVYGNANNPPGAVLEASMPYQDSSYGTGNGSSVACTLKSHPYQLTKWGYVAGNWYTTPTPTQIKNAIYTYGPVGAGICVSSAFQSYHGGVFSTDESGYCSYANHLIVLTGWNDAEGVWYLKNSWGTSWGESGYMRIPYGYSHIGIESTYVQPAGTPPPANNERATAIVITDTGADPLTYTDSARDVSSATTNKKDPALTRSLGKKYQTVWYQFTPVRTGILTVDTNGSNYDTILAIYSRRGSKLTQVGLDDNGGSDGLDSSLRIGAAAGVPLYIEVASSVSTDPADLTLNLNMINPVTYNPVLPDTLEDADTGDHLVFIGNWLTAGSLVGPSDGSLTTSSKTGSRVELTFYGRQISLVYSKLKGGGTMTVSIDGGRAISVAQTLARGAQPYMNEWRSGDLLTNGPHTLVLTHKRGKTVNLDAIIVKDNTSVYSGALPVGLEDDDEMYLSYKGFWQSISGLTDTSDGSLTTSLKTGSQAVITFYGRQVVLVYSKVKGGGTMTVSIDGGRAVSVSQSLGRGAQPNLNEWRSGDLLTNGPHTLVLTHKRGKTVNLDAIIVKDYAGTLPGDIEDSEDLYLSYKGFWQSDSGLSGPLGGTQTTSLKTGSSLQFSFSGTQFSILFTKVSGGGKLYASVDGGGAVPVVQTLKSGDMIYRNMWDSPVLADGIHTVILTHKKGKQVNVDAIHVH